MKFPQRSTRYSLVLVISATQVSAAINEVDTASHHQTLRVANNGLDSPSCGASSNRCRSITQGIANAAPGDTILVGPGRYGDINNDGDFDDPGDERIGREPTHGGAACMVCVSKPLRVLSTAGAERTVIEFQRQFPEFVPSVVDLRASGTTFGQAGKGFTIRNGLSVGLNANDVENMRIAGNIVVENMQLGFFGVGSGVISNNTVSGSEIGITAIGSWSVIQNTAIGNSALGIGASGTYALLRGNIATSNGRGFTVTAARAVVQNNSASGNGHLSGDASEGFFLELLDITFIGNSVIGNTGYGVRFATEAPHSATFKHNNIYGNDIRSNCGFVNQTVMTVDASLNYWGAPTGPGPDPADAAGPGSGCDLTFPTVVVPFAVREFANGR